MNAVTSRLRITEYMEALQRWDFDALDRLRHSDWVAEWPQSGERIRGSENDRQANLSYGGQARAEVTHTMGKTSEWAISPSNTLVQVRGAGPLWFVEAVNHYSSGPVHVFGVFEFKDDLVHRETIYFANPCEVPAWRRGWVESIPEGEPTSQVITTTEAETRHRQSALKHFVVSWIDQPDVDAARAHRISALGELFDESAVQDIPQSNERIRSLEKMIRVVSVQPNFPATVQLRRLVGMGNLFVAEVKLAYPEAIFWEANLLEFRGDKVVHSTHYYAQATDPPEWRSAWVERI